MMGLLLILTLRNRFLHFANPVIKASIYSKAQQTGIMMYASFVTYLVSLVCFSRLNNVITF